MATAPFDIAEAVPADDGIVSQFPTAERTFRDVVESWLLIEHNTYGLHAIQKGSTATRDAIVGIGSGFLFLNTDTSPPLLQVHDGTAFQSFIAVDNAVQGPASVTDAVIALFDGTTGKLIKAASEGILATVAQADAEAGTATARTIWTAQRVRQAIRGAGANCLQEVDVDEDGEYALVTGGGIPIDDTVPLVSEGTEVMSGSFTPLNTGSRIEVDVVCNLGSQNNGQVVAVLFVGSVAAAVGLGLLTTSGDATTIHFNHVIEAADHGTSPLTLSVRASGPTGSVHFNGDGGFSGSRLFGGKFISSIRAKEWL